MNWSKRTKVILVIILLGLIGAFVAYKIIYKPHELIENQKVAFTGTADDFKSEVALNSDKWQHAIVQINGELSDVDESGVMLNETIFCQFKKPETESNLKAGKSLTLKGRFIGYDDLLEEIKLDNCIIIN